MPNGGEKENERLTNVHRYLVEQGASVPSDFNEFSSKMKLDEKVSNNVYNYLKERGAKVPDSYDEFILKTGLKKKDTPTDTPAGVTGKGLQEDWASVNKYIEENEPALDLTLPTKEEQRQELGRLMQGEPLPSEVQPGQVQEPSEAEQLQILRQVNPEEAQRLEAEITKREQAVVVEEEIDAKALADIKVLQFSVAYTGMLEEADRMEFDTFDAYADSQKDDIAGSFLINDGDEAEYKLRRQAEKLEKTRKKGGPVSEEQIAAILKEADAVRTGKYEEANDKIAVLRNLLKKGHQDVVGGKIARVEITPLTEGEITEIKKDIRFQESLQADVFEKDPAKLAASAKEAIESDEGSKLELARVAETMPKGLSGKEKFDRYYNVQYKKYRDLGERLGIDTDPEGISTIAGMSAKRGNISPLMALKSATGFLNRDEKEFLSTLRVLERLAPTYLLNQTGVTGQEGFWATYWNHFGTSFFGETALEEREQLTVRGIQEVFNIVGIPDEQLTTGAAEALTEVGKEYTYDDWEGSKKNIAMLLGTVTDIGLKFTIGGGPAGLALKGTRIGRTLNALSQKGKLYQASNKFYQTISKVPGVTKFMARSTKTGLKGFSAGKIFTEDQDELGFINMFLGSSASQLVSGASAPIIKRIYGMFGKSTPLAVRTVEAYASAGAGELAEESMQELYQIYRDTDNGKEFSAELERRFGKTSQKIEFIAASLLLGPVFNNTNTDFVKEYYKEFNAKEKAIIDELSREIANDITQAANTAVEETMKDSGIKLDVPPITDEAGAERAAEIKKVLSKDLKLFADEKESEITNEERGALRDELRAIESTPADQPAYTEAVEEPVTKEAAEGVLPVEEKAPVEGEEVAPVTEEKAVEAVPGEVEVEKAAEVEPDVATEVEAEKAVLDKPLKDVDIKEKGNYDRVIDFLKKTEADLEKFEKGTFGAANLPVIPAKIAVKAIRKAIEGGKSMVEAIESGLQAVKDSEWYKSLTEEKKTGVEDAYIEDLNNNFQSKAPKGKTKVQKQIEKTTEGKITGKVVTTEKNIVKRLIGSFGKGVKAGVKITKQDIKSSVAEELKSLKNKLTQDQIVSIVSKTTSTNFDNPKSVKKLSDYINKTILDADYKAAKEITGDTAVAELTGAIQAITSSGWYKKLSQKSKDKLSVKFGKDIVKTATVKAKKGAIKAQIKESVQPKSKEVSVKEKQSLKEKFQSLAKHEKVTQKAIQQAVQEGLEPLKGKLSKSQISSITNKVKQTEFGSPKSVAKLEEHLDKVVSNSNYAEDLNKARTNVKRLKKAIKNKRVPLELENIAKKLAAIPVEKIDSIEKYNEVAEAYWKKITGVTAVLPREVDSLFEELGKEQFFYNARIDESRLRREFEGSNLSNTMDFRDYKLLNTIAKQTEAEAEKAGATEKQTETKRDFLEEVIPDRIDQLRDMAKDEDVDLDADQRRTISVLGGVDIKSLSTPQLVDLNNIITSILVFDSYSKVGSLETFIVGEKKADFIVNKYAGKFRTAGMLSGLRTLQGYIDSIVKGENTAAAFSNDLFGDLTDGKNRAYTASDNFNKKMDKAFEGMNMKNSLKIGMASFIVQYQAGTAEEMLAEFDSRKSGVPGTIKGLMEMTEDDLSTTSSEAKRHKEVLKHAEAIYNEHFKDAKTREEVVSKLTPREKKAYDMMVNEFGKNADALFDSMARYGDKESPRYVHYLPTEAASRDAYIKKGFDIDDVDAAPSSTFTLMDTQQAGTTIARQEVDPSGKTIYNFDIFNVAKRKYAETVYDIETLRARKILKRVINNPEFAAMLKEPIRDALAKRLESSILAQKKQDYNGVEELPTFYRRIAKVIRHGKMLKLATLDQVIKQPVPVLAHTAIYNGADTLTKAMAILGVDLESSKNQADFQKLTAGTDLANRLALGDPAIAQQMNKAINKLSEYDVVNKTEKYYNSIVEASLWTLKRSDNYAARVSWLSSYLYSLQKQGKKLKDFDLAKEAANPNKEALGQAKARTDRINNISDFSETSELYKRKDIAGVITREMLFNFKSFQINGTLSFATSVRNAADLSIPWEERRESLKFMSGYIAQQYIFAGIKQFILAPLWATGVAAILNAFGQDTEPPKEESIEEGLKKLAIKGTADIALGWMPTPLESYAKKGINAGTLILKKELWDLRFGDDLRRPGQKIPPRPTKYSANLFYVGDNELMGSYAIGEDLIGDITESLIAIGSGKELKPSDYALMGKTLAFPTGSGDVDRTMSKVYWMLKQKEKKKREKKKKRSWFN